jgi:hypothetical protein
MLIALEDFINYVAMKVLNHVAENLEETFNTKPLVYFLILRTVVTNIYQNV